MHYEQNLSLSSANGKTTIWQEISDRQGVQYKKENDKDWKQMGPTIDKFSKINSVFRF